MGNCFLIDGYRMNNMNFIGYLFSKLKFIESSEISYMKMLVKI